jgi:hypothetical protein
MDELQNVQTVFSWKAPLRPYKKRSSTILRFYLAITLLLSLIIFFFGDKILLVPLWALVFLFYTLTITPPPDVENKITKFGVEVAGVTLRWESLSHFYFSSRFGYGVLTVVSHAPYFYHAYAVVPDEETKKQLMHLLSEHLIYKDKPEKTFTDRIIDWFSGLIPNDEEKNIIEAPASVLAKPQPASP